MSFVEWSKSSVDYGRKLVDSALEGAREGEDQFLEQESLAPYISESARHAIAPAVIGACVGAVGGYLLGGRRSTSRILAFGLAGAVIGLGAGLIWESRPLTSRMVLSAWDKVSKTRDQHWFEKNPIDYA